MVYVIWAVVFKANSSMLRAEAQAASAHAPRGLGGLAEEVVLRKVLRNGVMIRFALDFVQVVGLLALLHSSAFTAPSPFDASFAAPLAWAAGGYHVMHPITCLLGDGAAVLLFELLFPLFAIILVVAIGGVSVFALWVCCKRPTALAGVEEVTVGDQVRVGLCSYSFIR